MPIISSKPLKLRKYLKPLVKFSPRITASALLLASVCSAHAVDLERAQSTLIPKRETGVIEFLKDNPKYDGRDVVIAVLDTGVDPAALGLQTTSTGKRKILDIIDGSGGGDVDMSHIVELKDISKSSPLIGLTGRTLTLPKRLKSPSKQIRIGMKRGDELFHREPWDRLMTERKEAWALKNNRVRGERKSEEKVDWEDKHPNDRSLKEQDLAARKEMLESLEKSFIDDSLGPVYDCVLWFDGDDYRVIVDTDEDGDLTDETVLRPFGVDGEYARFADPVSATFAVQVYDEGELLSIVTVSGSHGTHVAAIAAANFPDEPQRNGIAPGAQILSITVGDVRLGGGGDGVGYFRAVASAAQYGVDIMNLSFGGGSTYQDGSSYSPQLFDRLVRDYGVTAFASVGNNGPGLSTLGSPGGVGARVIGVGAFTSSEMGKYLYSLTDESPDTAFGFSSRGPAKNGDLGVDIFAPGAATASLASDSLRGSQMYNGTSMSSPSAAGVGALLVSAAKQLKIKTSPERIKAALINTAKSVTDNAFSEGAGLIQIAPALEYLKSTKSEPTLDIFFDLNSSVGTFRGGPGVYLRESLTDSKIDIPISISPELSKRKNDTAAYEWEADVTLKTDQPWLIAPEYMRLANGVQRITLSVDATQLPKDGTVASAQLTGTLSNNPSAGVIFTFPVTIIQPIELSNPIEYRHEGTYSLSAGSPERIFLQAPEAADQVELKVKLPDDGTDTSRVFMVNIMTLADNAWSGDKKLTSYLRLSPGEERTLRADVHSGQVVEITLLQRWSSPGAYNLGIQAQFEGLGLEENSLSIAKNRDFAMLSLRPLRDLNAEVTAQLTHSALSFYSVKTERFPGDPRMKFPPPPRKTESYTPFRLRQTFELEVEEDTKIALGSGRDFDTQQDLAGHFHTVYGSTGELLQSGSASRLGAVTLPKGKATITRDILAFDESFLDSAEDTPLLVTMENKIGSLKVYQDIPAITRDKSDGKIALNARKHQTLFFKNTLADAISKLKPTPDYVYGNVSFKNSADAQLSRIPIWVQPGDDFKKVANPEPDPKKDDTKKAPLEVFADELYDKRLAFVNKHITSSDSEIINKRDKVLAELKSEYPEKAELFLTEAKIAATAAYLLPEFMGRPEEGEKGEKGEEGEEGAEKESKVKQDVDARKAIETNLEKARTLSDLASVAQYFGSPEVSFPGDIEARQKHEKLKKEMQDARKVIADSWRLQTAIAVELDDAEAFRTGYTELLRWEKEADKETDKLLRTYYRAQNLLGLTLQKLNEEIAKNPADAKLRETRIDIYRELGWQDLATRDSLKLKLEKAAPLNLL